MSKQINGFITWVRSFLDEVYAPKGSGGDISLNDVYPVGSIYMSVNNTSPQTLFGGTWVQLTNTFLYATSTTADTGTTATAGESSHTLNSNEMPSHTHTQNAHNHYFGDESGDYRIPRFKNPDNWGYTSKINISSSSGSYYYVRSSANTGGLGEIEHTMGVTATNQNTGGGQAHNNMPPYMKVYMWKRTA